MRHRWGFVWEEGMAVAELVCPDCRVLVPSELDDAVNCPRELLGSPDTLFCTDCARGRRLKKWRPGVSLRCSIALAWIARSRAAPAAPPCGDLPNDDEPPF